MKGTCACCGASFDPHPAVKGQKYCSRGECQRARRRRWQREKLAVDEAYRHNQAAAQQSWRARNPDYWRRYRLRHPEYAQRNRELQRQRNRQRRWGSEDGSIAKMDALTGRNNDISGLWKLVPFGVDGIAKMDALVVKIDVIQGTCPQGP
jgi:hypothetical protein